MPTLPNTQVEAALVGGSFPVIFDPPSLRAIPKLSDRPPRRIGALQAPKRRGALQQHDTPPAASTSAQVGQFFCPVLSSCSVSLGDGAGIPSHDCRPATPRYAGAMMKVILIIAAFMLWTSSATAQKPVAPCTADEKRLCVGIPPGRDSLRSCFRAHIHELSDACLLALARLSAVDRRCRSRLKSECASVEPGEGRLESCLRSAAANLDEACKNSLSRAIPNAK